MSARLRKAQHNRLMERRKPSRPATGPSKLLPKVRLNQSTLCRCKAIAGKGCNCTTSVSVPLIITDHATQTSRAALTCGPCQKGRHQPS